MRPWWGTAPHRGAEDGGAGSGQGLGTQHPARRVCSSPLLSDTARGSSGELGKRCTWRGGARDPLQNGRLFLPSRRDQGGT